MKLPLHHGGRSAEQSFLLGLVCRKWARMSDSPVFKVRVDSDSSIISAIEACPAGGTIEIAAGYYQVYLPSLYRSEVVIIKTSYGLVHNTQSSQLPGLMYDSIWQDTTFSLSLQKQWASFKTRLCKSQYNLALASIVLLLVSSGRSTAGAFENYRESLPSWSKHVTGGAGGHAAD